MARSRANITPPFLKWLLIIVFATAISGCAKDLVTGKSTMNWYTIDQDIVLGNQVMKAQIKELRRGKKKVDSKKNQEELLRLRRIVKRLAPYTHYPRFPYEVHLADVDLVNASAAPGGKIIVFEGLWDPKKGLVEKGNDAQLAAVLAHEIAHATARHVTEAVSRGMTIGLIGTAAQGAAYAGGGANAAYAVGQAAGLGFNLYFPVYSRGNESEADRVGLIYMAKAGYDPRVAVELWKRAARMAKKQGKNEYSIFSSHPPSGVRAQQLEKILPEAMNYYMAARNKYETPKKESEKKSKRR